MASPVEGGAGSHEPVVDHLVDRLAGMAGLLDQAQDPSRRVRSHGPGSRDEEVTTWMGVDQSRRIGRRRLSAGCTGGCGGCPVGRDRPGAVRRRDSRSLPAVEKDRPYARRRSRPTGVGDRRRRRRAEVAQCGGRNLCRRPPVTSGRVDLKAATQITVIAIAAAMASNVRCRADRDLARAVAESRQRGVPPGTSPCRSKPGGLAPLGALPRRPTEPPGFLVGQLDVGTEMMPARGVRRGSLDNAWLGSRRRSPRRSASRRSRW